MKYIEPRFNKKLMRNQIAEEMEKYQFKDRLHDDSLQKAIEHQEYMLDIKMIRYFLKDD